MKKICSWCNKVLDQGENVQGEDITHGMCAECYRKSMKENGLWDEESLKKYLEYRQKEFDAETHWDK